MLHQLALGQFHSSYPTLNIFLGNMQIDGYNIDFIHSFISV